MTERRYRDEEVRKILELATRADASPPTKPAADGLTLAEIQSIALEVGVAPDVISRAAASLDATSAPARTSWGMPIEVGRVVPLPRALTDHEWTQLVAELRSTFRARGKVVAEQGLREWSNGNLHAAVEPTEKGYRLRLGTLKSNASGLNTLGAIGATAGAVILGAGALTGGATESLLGPIILAVSGAGMFVANLVRLPRWAQQRRGQMEHIEARVRAILANKPEPEADSRSSDPSTA